MAQPEILSSVADGTATITLNRPDQRNALTPRLIDELVTALHHAEQQHEVRVIVVTATPPGFSVGADLGGGHRGLANLIAADRHGQAEEPYVEPANRVVHYLRSMRKPVIAAVNGDAIGGGATIAAGMDFRVAGASARFGFVFTRRGLTPEGCSTWLLPRLVGRTTATDWLLSGRVFGADAALSAGFLTAVVPDDEVASAAQRLAADLVRNTSAHAVATTKRLLRYAEHAAHPTGVSWAESAALSDLIERMDAVEGISSFLQGRPARFTSTGQENLPELPVVPD